MNLVIVESPAKSKTIKKFLGSNYKISASMGHIRDLPKSQFGIDVDNNFEPKYITIRGKSDLIKALKKDAKAAKKIYLATDPDREGEAISWHLANLIPDEVSKIQRVTFNEITEKAVKNAIKNPREIDMNLVNAQQARRVLDRIVGYKISPILWRKVHKGLSAGRVQSVALRLIVDRETEIDNFTPEEYWSLMAELLPKKAKKAFKAKFYGTSDKKIEIHSKEEMDKIIADLDNAKYVVQSIKEGEKKRNPAPPFITSTLQQDASRKYGFSTSKTMMIAQQLYEGLDIEGRGTIGLITYMRTDSTRIADVARDAAHDIIVKKFGNEYYPEKPRVYKSKKSAQDAHEAIRPSYPEIEPASIKSSLKPDQFKLYKLIWERFIASQMESAVYNTLGVDITADKYLFKANGSTIKFPGYMALYTEGLEEGETEEKDTLLPELTENETLTNKGLLPEQHFTEPPPRFSEASLVKALEEKGIGRPSTYSPTISTIIARNYVEREKKILLPTELGKVVTELLKEHFTDIMDISFTANLEKELDEVEEGTADWVELIRKFYDPFAKILEIAETKIGKVELKDEESDVPCDKCGRMMVIKQGRFGKFLACPGFPECRNTKAIVEDTGAKCPKCGNRVIVRKSKKGRKFFACENSQECGFMTWDTPTKENCPNCGSFLGKRYSKKGNQYICSNEACGYEKKK